MAHYDDGKGVTPEESIVGESRHTIELGTVSSSQSTATHPQVTASSNVAIDAEELALAKTTTGLVPFEGFGYTADAVTKAEEAVCEPIPDSRPAWKVHYIILSAYFFAFSSLGLGTFTSLHLYYAWLTYCNPHDYDFSRCLAVRNLPRKVAFFHIFFSCLLYIIQECHLLAQPSLCWLDKLVKDH